jgi:hypothetical protein|tara:strand:- start:208 stop:708 length:501 start_codon:yes stop_codon:yes gene_type:complete
MKQYSLTTNNGTPKAEIHNFVDTIEAGVIVVELANGKYYIHRTNWIAKTLRTWNLGIYENDYLHDNPPVKFVEKYLTETNKTIIRGGSPELRVAMQKAQNNMHNAIYYNYLERHGHTKVKSSKWLQYGQKGFESKTNHVDSFIHQVKYDNILIGDKANGKRKRKAS